jgi:dTDP-4-dehydrorhamnose reductase
VLITGARGQVGAELARAFAAHAQVTALDRAALDLSSRDRIAQAVRSTVPQLILNAAAYTAVDRAESEPDAARAVNGVAPGALAEEAKRCGALLVHYSTDYVFDGTKPSPYVETDATAPLNVYGATKLEGERAIAAAGAAHVILRTSWIYGPHGRNFMLTMLQLAASRPELRVVDDQRGAPTSAIELARATFALFTGGAPRAIEASDVARVGASSGLYHASAAGETTWCGFAREIFSMRSRQDASFRPPRLTPIATSEYPTPARRPANSVLSNAKLRDVFGVALADWRRGLEEALSALGDR